MSRDPSGGQDGQRPDAPVDGGRRPAAPAGGSQRPGAPPAGGQRPPAGLAETADLPPQGPPTETSALPGATPAAPAATAGPEPQARAEHHPFSAGHTVGSRYRIEEYLACGGQAWVYRVRDVAPAGLSAAATPTPAATPVQGPGQEFALKIYKEGFQPPGEDRVRLLAGLRHPNLLAILGFGWEKTRFFEVLPLARGGRVIEDRSLTLERIIREILPAVTDALEYCHSHSVIHRDVKPHNLFYLGPGHMSVVLGDFGIASILPEGESLVFTKTARTAGYAAPEVRTSLMGAESDYYSLGVTLLHLATGVSPFAGMSEEQIDFLTVAGTLPIPDSLPPRFRSLLRGLTVKERNDRWGAEEIGRWLRGEEVAIPESSGAGSRGAVPPFDFEGRTYTDQAELARGLADQWVEGQKRLYRGQLREWARAFDLDLANHLQDIEENENDHDVGLFRAIHLLDPRAPFLFRKLRYETPARLGDGLGRALASGDQETGEAILAALKQGLILVWLQSWTGGTVSPSVFPRLVELASLTKGDSQFALRRLHYLLSPDAPFVFGGVRVSTVLELATVLARDWRAGSKLPGSEDLRAWLFERGREDEARLAERAKPNYASDPERGLAAFLPIIYPGAVTDPAVVDPYRFRVALRLAAARAACSHFVFLDSEAQDLLREGGAFFDVDLTALDLPGLVALHGKVEQWRKHLDALRQKRDGATVLDPVPAAGTVAAATALSVIARHGAAILEDLERFGRELCPGAPAPGSGRGAAPRPMDRLVTGTLELGVPFDLLRAAMGGKSQLAIAQTIERLRNDLKLDPRVSTQVVGTWALALGLVRLGTSRSRPQPRSAGPLPAGTTAGPARRPVAEPPASGARLNRLAMGSVVVALVAILGLAIFWDELPWASPKPAPGATETSGGDRTGSQQSSTPGGTGTSTSGSLSSGTSGSSSSLPAIFASNHPYAAGPASNWTVARDGALELRLHFGRVTLGSGDSLSVQDENGITACSYAPKTDNRSGVWTDWVSGDSLTVRLETDSSGNAWGFSVDQIQERWTLLTGAVAESFHPYGDNSRYTWAISRSGASKLRLHFSTIDLGKGDYLTIRDAAGNVLQRYSENFADDDIWSDWFAAGSVVVEFRTNYGDCHWGFKVDSVQTQ